MYRCVSQFCCDDCLPALFVLAQIWMVLIVRFSISSRTCAYRRGLRAERICRAARTALEGSRTVITGTLLGARKDDQTSSGNSLTLAGTVMTGMVDIAESDGPAPFDRPMYAMITESGTSCIIRWKMLAAVIGSLCTEQVTTVIKLFRSPSASENASVLSFSDPLQRMIR